ncbi:MAG: GNAT family N-acetyltransferase [Olsenella sp.]|nr:GNAT family N-acetyltransferase [Olsenella sp.]
MAEDRLWGSIVSLDAIDQDALCAFRCGVDDLDRWLRESARADDARGRCRTHVCVEPSGAPFAFFTLSATSIRSSDVSRGCRGGMSGLIPATLLGKMGVRTDVQGNGCGTRVLRHAMRYALRSSRLVSSRLLVVDALNDDLVPWYESRGFVRLPEYDSRLVCKQSTLSAICEGLGESYFVS